MHEVIGRVGNGAPDSDRTGLAEPPEERAAVMPRSCSVARSLDITDCVVC